MMDDKVSRASNEKTIKNMNRHIEQTRAPERTNDA